MAEARDGLVEIPGGLEPQDAQTKLTAVFDFRFKLAIAERDPLPDRYFSTRLHQRFPSLRSERANQQNFDFTAQMLRALWVAFAGQRGVNPLSPAEEARGQHASVIQNDELVAAQQFRQIPELPVDPVAGKSAQFQHSRAIALRGRPLRDQFGWKVKVEFAKVHEVCGRPESCRAHAAGGASSNCVKNKLASGSSCRSFRIHCSESVPSFCFEVIIGG